MYSVDSCVPIVNAFNFTKLTNKITKKKIPNSPKFEMHYIDCIKWSRCFRFQTFSCPLHLFDNKFSFLSNKRENKATNGTIDIPGTYLIPFLCSLQRPQFWVFSNKEILSLSRMIVFIFKQSLSGIETFPHILRDTVSPINSMICIDTSFKTCYAYILFYYCMGINYQNGDFCY